ncbi:MAG: hypothetical protein JWQ00_928 [Noviherbaspirillum sp.]|nr:hypothetical protein [Noviherbaspirillum sp.]
MRQLLIVHLVSGRPRWSELWYVHSGYRFDQESEIYMSNVIERSEFSSRLREALRREGYPESATRLAREFNSRFAGNPVSVHAVRKWLMGEAIPTQEKLRLLSQWFGVSAEWLRFGTGELKVRIRRRELSPFHSTLAHDVTVLDEYKHLNENGRRIVCEIIRLLAQVNSAE